MRAGAIETHVKISQEPLHAEIYSKNAVPQNEPRTRTHILRKPAQSKPRSRFHSRHFTQKFTGKMPRPSTTVQTLCEPAQSKRTSRFHKSHFTPKLTGKMPRPRLSPDCRRTLCASLRRRNACQDFTRAASIYRKNAAPQIAPGTQTCILCEPAQSKCMSTCHKRD